MNFPFTPSVQYTAIALAYRNRDMIADQVLPRITVTKRSFKWDKHEKAGLFQVPSTLVGRKGKPNEVEFKSSEETSSVSDYGLEDAVPQDDIDAASDKPGLDPLGKATEGVTELIMLDREIRTANLVFSDTTYPTGNKLELSGSTDKWNAYAEANSDPVADILTAKEAALMPYNTCVMGESVWFALRRHPALIKAFFPVNSSGGGILSLQQFQELFEFNTVLIGRAKKATSKPGQILAIGDVWGDSFAMLHQNPLADIRGNRITFGATAEYGTRIAGANPDRNIGLRGGQRVRVGESVKELITAPDCGYLLYNVL